MYTQSELQDAIDELQKGSHTIQNCSKLASAYIVLDHISPSSGYSTESKPVQTVEKTVDIVGDYGNTEFLGIIKGRNAPEMWLLMDELMSTLSVLNPRLYDSVIDKIIM